MKKNKQDALANDALLKEIADDVKSDQLKSLWDQYGLVIVIAVALILTAAVSFETFRNWVNKRNQEVSNAYAVAISLQNQGRLDESMKILQNLAENGSGVYSDIAKLQMANIYFEQNKSGEAVEILQYLAHSNKVSSQMQEIAALKLAAYELDNNAPAEDVKELLMPLAKADSDSYNVARELLAMLYIREGDLEAAKTEYEQIIASANSSDALKSRAQDMITIINDQNQ